MVLVRIGLGVLAESGCVFVTGSVVKYGILILRNSLTILILSDLQVQSTHSVSIRYIFHTYLCFIVVVVGLGGLAKVIL